jgi:chromosome segregation ATPase
MRGTEPPFQGGEEVSALLEIRFLNGETYATVRIEKLDDEDLNNATKMQIELLKTKKELSLTVEKLRETVEELNKSMREIEKLEKEKASLENELKILNERYEDLQMKYEAISKELEGKKTKLMEMEKEVQSLSDLSLTYRASMLFLASIFIGSLTSLAIKGMRKS